MSLPNKANGVTQDGASSLIAAIEKQEYAQLQQLITSNPAPRIHTTQQILTSTTHTQTPLQVALSQPDNGQSLHHLLTAYLTQATKSQQTPADLQSVITELTQRIVPSFIVGSTQSDSDLTQPMSQDEDAIAARMQAALSAIARGEFIVVTDRHDRENEGDLIIAAQHCTEQKIAFMVNHTSGIICVGMTAERLEQELQLPQMVQQNTESHRTAFTVSVDYKDATTTTGISAHDRALTMRQLTNPQVKPEQFNRPGHVFPLRASAGGVLERAGHTEASVDICRWAGLYPAGAMCEITKPNGSMMRPIELRSWAKQYNIAMCSIEDMQHYSRQLQVKAAQ